MSFYVRKITRSKWPKKGENCNIGKIRADAVTVDLKTSNDKLSVWWIESIDEIDKAILALASGAQKLDAMDFVAIPEEVICKHKLEIDQKDGKTPAEAYIKLHRDIIGLNYDSISIIIDEIKDIIKSNKVYRRTSGQLVKLVKQGVGDKIVNQELLDQRVKEQIKDK